MKKNYLLGVNEKDKKIYLGEFEITTRNGYEEFTASFDVGEAFNIDSIDDSYKQDYFESLWECYDAEGKLNLLNDGELTKKEVFENWDDCDYHDIKDCSCTDFELTTKNDVTINFESVCGGQHDIREDQEEFENIIFTDKKAVLLLLDLWDKYHLQNIENNKEAKKQIEEVTKRLEKYEEYTDDVENFIIEHIGDM